MKAKNEMSALLNDAIEIVTDVMTAADLITTASKKTLLVISGIRTLFDIPDEPEEETKAEPKKKAELKKKEPEPAPEPETEETPEQPKEYTKTEVRKILSAAADKHRSEVKALLTKYGADNITHLDSAHYAAIVADAEELING